MRLQKLQCVSRGGIEWFVDDFQIDELLVHSRPAFWIHLTKLRAARIVSRNEMAVPQLLPGELHPLRIERWIDSGSFTSQLKPCPKKHLAFPPCSAGQHNMRPFVNDGLIVSMQNLNMGLAAASVLVVID